MPGKATPLRAGRAWGWRHRGLLQEPAGQAHWNEEAKLPVVSLQHPLLTKLYSQLGKEKNISRSHLIFREQSKRVNLELRLNQLITGILCSNFRMFRTRKNSFLWFSRNSCCLEIPRYFSGKESACQRRRCRRHRFDPWIGKVPWRRKWQPTPVFLPGKFHGQRSLASCSPWAHKGQTRLSMHTALGNSLKVKVKLTQSYQTLRLHAL